MLPGGGIRRLRPAGRPMALKVSVLPSGSEALIGQIDRRVRRWSTGCPDSRGSAACSRRSPPPGGTARRSCPSSCPSGRRARNPDCWCRNATGPAPCRWPGRPRPRNVPLPVELAAGRQRAGIRNRSGSRTALKRPRKPLMAELTGHDLRVASRAGGAGDAARDRSADPLAGLVHAHAQRADLLHVGGRACRSRRRALRRPRRRA